MHIYPVIQISGGRCIYPNENDYNRSRIFTSHPLKMAQKWEDEGAGMLHIVDVDGASSGSSANMEVIRTILEQVHIPVQVGGGIRSIKDIDQYINMGINRVVIGTKAIENAVFVKEAVNLFGSERILVAIDAKDGMIATEGRKKLSHYHAFNFASNMRNIGIDTIIYTDILRRGLDNGSGVMQAREIADKLRMNVIYSGGIKSLKDIEAFRDMGLYGIILGKALYEARFSLKDANVLCRQPGGGNNEV